MALSESVLNSLNEAESHLRNALAFAARSERPFACKSIAQLIFKLELIQKTDETLDMIDERVDGDSGEFPPHIYDEDYDL
tara:strand:+ start:498 stop:737 length:240 start_codon:yes stop_codon:yes gene_type:complete